MNNARMIGNNISTLLKKNNLTPPDLAEKIELSIQEIYRVLEGRIFLSPMILDRIANVFGVTRNELITMADGCDSSIHNFKVFSDEENQEKILDFIDMYADLAEML